jgi:hypothetical protein
VLLTLDDVGITCVIAEHAEIEFDDDPAAGAIPDAELRFDQAAPRYLFDDAELFQHLEGRCMCGRRAGTVIDAGVGLEQPDLEPLSCERQAH